MKDIPMVVTYALLGLQILCSLGANILMKYGAAESQLKLMGPFSLYSLAGLSLYGVSYVAYARVLQTVPLYFAQGILTIQYILVNIAAFYIFGEDITFTKWIGIAAIILGIYMISRQ